MTFEKDYAEYYDILYLDKNYVAEAEFIRSLIERYAPGTKKILELGCGTGIHASLLAEKGYIVHGIDISESMLEKAEERRKQLSGTVAERLKFIEGDIRTFKSGEKYDVVLSLFHVINYLNLNEDLKAAFSTASAHLVDRGAFIFDCWYGPAVLTHPPAVRVKRMLDKDLSIVRISEPNLRPNDNSVIVDFTLFIENKLTGAIKHTAEKHRMRYLFMPEILDLLSSQGMMLVAAREWLTEREPCNETFGVYFVGKRR